MEILSKSQSLATHLSCSECGEHYEISQLQSFATCCEKPLIVDYRLTTDLNRTALIGRESSMWRYAEMLPLFHKSNRVSLGEGMTPIVPITSFAARLGFSQLSVKDEGQNPTGSFKSRGISMALSKAKENGVTECVIPTAGNAGGALSAYAAAGKIGATVIMPKHTPKAFQDECRLFGAQLILIEGLIDSCGKRAGSIAKETGAFDFSTLKEPYRLEGKKTLGYEIAEQMNWDLPDVIVYPTGGGTGLIGIWKAFQEMIRMGWLKSSDLPKMIVVQSKNCAPMVDFINGNKSSLPYGESKANGLAVPKAFGQDMINSVVKESGGAAVAVSEESILSCTLEMSRATGISFSPEGGATWAGLLSLVDAGVISREEKILLINTGNAYKYMEHLL